MPHANDNFNTLQIFFCCCALCFTGWDSCFSAFNLVGSGREESVKHKRGGGGPKPTNLPREGQGYFSSTTVSICTVQSYGLMVVVLSIRARLSLTTQLLCLDFYDSIAEWLLPWSVHSNKLKHDRSLTPNTFLQIRTSRFWAKTCCNILAYFCSIRHFSSASWFSMDSLGIS